MARMHVRSSAELPASIKYQLLSFVRTEWWWTFRGDNRLWDYTEKDTHPVNVYIAEDDVLISHAEVNWRYLTHSGERLKVYGLSAVFTYPAFRKEGFGHRVVDAATAEIQASDGDVAMLFCSRHLKGFYEASGWIPMDSMRVLYGSKDPPAKMDYDELCMMLFLSERGRRARPSFEREPVYVGSQPW